MFPNRQPVRRRAIALVSAYLLALHGLLLAWGAVAAIAAHAGTGLASIICTADGSPGHRSGELPPCCACGPMCGSSSAPTLGAAPVAAPVLTWRVLLPADRWSRLAPAPARPISSDPRKARAPPVLA